MSLRQSARSFSSRMWDRLFDSRCKPRRNPQRSRLSLESLEDRLAPATLTVLNTSDSGIGSLRAQIALAQSGDTILFDATVFANHPTIALGSSLGIIHSVSITGPTKGVTLDAGGRFEVIDVRLLGGRHQPLFGE